VTPYLLDTTALIDFSKNREPARTWILELIESSDQLAVCLISVAEFYVGIPPEHPAVWDGFIEALTYWEGTSVAARDAGSLRYALARQGVTISTTDAIIAAIAREHQAVIITDNAKDFPVQGLALLSLRD
jgi:predicted nucleic acid-binding protein